MLDFELGMPVPCTETQATAYKQTRVSYTYEDLLQMFSDGSNLIRPLVERCMAYEDEIRYLRDQLSEAEREADQANDKLSDAYEEIDLLWQEENDPTLCAVDDDDDDEELLNGN